MVTEMANIEKGDRDRRTSDIAHPHREESDLLGPDGNEAKIAGTDTLGKLGRHYPAARELDVGIVSIVWILHHATGKELRIEERLGRERRTRLRQHGLDAVDPRDRPAFDHPDPVTAREQLDAVRGREHDRHSPKLNEPSQQHVHRRPLPRRQAGERLVEHERASGGAGPQEQDTSAQLGRQAAHRSARDTVQPRERQQIVQDRGPSGIGEAEADIAGHRQLSEQQVAGTYRDHIPPSLCDACEQSRPFRPGSTEKPDAIASIQIEPGRRKPPHRVGNLLRPLQPGLVRNVLVPESAERKTRMFGNTKKVEAIADDTREQLLGLRDQVERLLNERVNPAITEAAGRAETAVSTARDFTSTQADTVSKKVRGQPLIAIGVSAAVGYLLGRIAR